MREITIGTPHTIPHLLGTGHFSSRGRQSIGKGFVVLVLSLKSKCGNEGAGEAAARGSVRLSRGRGGELLWFSQLWRGGGVKV